MATDPSVMLDGFAQYVTGCSLTGSRSQTDVLREISSQEELESPRTRHFQILIEELPNEPEDELTCTRGRMVVRLRVHYVVVAKIERRIVDDSDRISRWLPGAVVGVASIQRIDSSGPVVVDGPTEHRLAVEWRVEITYDTGV